MTVVFLAVSVVIAHSLYKFTANFGHMIRLEELGIWFITLRMGILVVGHMIRLEELGIRIITLRVGTLIVGHMIRLEELGIWFIYNIYNTKCCY